MELRSAFTLAGGRRLALLWRVSGLLQPYYRIMFVASAVSSGLCALLRGGPQPFERIAIELAPDPAARDGLRAWLELGVALGELDKGPGGYGLEGALSRELAHASNDDVAALLEEVACFHQRLVLETPARLKRGELWAADDHDACLIARSSRILEPFLFAALDSALPVSGELRLLDLGCGAGTYLRRAAARNPRLRAVGIERSPAVAAAARAAVERGGLSDRVTIETGDLRQREGGGGFDFAMLLNVIYYFPVRERPDVVAKVASFLRPGGRLLLASSCRGGSEGMRVLDIWCSSTEGSGPLPAREQLTSLLAEAGLGDIEVKRAIPGEQYYLVSGRKRD